jgi:hypothetical protein
VIVSALIKRLQKLQAEHGDVPVYLVSDGGNVQECGSTGYDMYEEDEGRVIEIIAKGES